MQAGVREVLPQLLRREAQQAVSRAAALLSSAGESVGDLYAFVPAKPGCGATTVATYATAIAARLAEEPTLLLDFDVRLGVTSFLLKAQGGHTIVDGLAQAGRLDPDLWASLVCERGNLHLLGSGPVDFSQTIPSARFAELLDFAVRRYPAVSVDLPGSMEDYERDTLMRAKRIYLVCTPDISCLHVARRKSSWLRDLSLTDRVSVVLNRFERRSTLSVSSIERIIQLPVRYLLPDGAHEIARAVEKGVILEGSSPLAKQIANLAADIAPAKPAGKKANPVRRFVEYFSVSPAREKQSETMSKQIQGD
jgi:pilus assembly protein CpaE